MTGRANIDVVGCCENHSDAKQKAFSRQITRVKSSFPESLKVKNRERDQYISGGGGKV